MSRIYKKLRGTLAVVLVFVMVASIAVPSVPSQAATKKYVKSLKVSPKKVTLTAGGKKTIKATVKVKGKAKKTVTVKSSNTKVVTVKAKKANRKGVSKITLTAKNVTAKKRAKITVTTSAKNKKGKKVKKVIQVTVNPKSGSSIKPTASPEIGDDKQEEPTAPPETGDDKQEKPTTPPEIGGDNQEKPTTPPETGDDNQEKPTTPPEIGDDKQEKPTTPPETGDDKQEKPTAPPETGNDNQEKPTAPPETGGDEQEEPAPSLTDDGVMRQGLTSAQVAKEMGVGINLGNTMEAHWTDEKNNTTGAQTIGDNTPQDYEKCWGAVETTKECIDGMKAAGFSTVRIPVYWGNMMADDGKFEINKAYMNRVAEIIDYCRANEVYVVINIHHYDEFIIKNYEKDKVLEITKKLWTQIASRYKNYSDYLIFEGFNENLGSYKKEGSDWPEKDIYAYVNAMNQTFVDAVRATGGNNSSRMLIASGYWTNIDLTTNQQFVMPKDTVEDRLMVSVHYVDNSMYWSKQIGGDTWLQYAESQCRLLKQAFTDKGIQVFVGECTSIYDEERYAKDAKHKESSECLQIMLEKIMDYGFVPVLWDVNNGFYSRTENKIKSDTDAAVIRELSGRP